MTTRVVAGRFRLIEPLGRGGMGTVWRAEDQVLGRIVALKEVSLPPALDESERDQMRRRVFREARAAARLNHPAAVTVYDVLEEDDYTFIAMEMVDSPTLLAIVEEQGPLAPARAAGIGLRLVEALEAAHAEGIVHRDVKPANVMVAGDLVKLADFGVASVKGDPQLTATGLLLGSPSYMSPEQASGEPAGPASDLWALGATLHFAVEGEGPFDREGPLPTLMAITNEPPPEPVHAGPLAPVIRALLDKDPGRRPGPERLREMLGPVAVAAQPAKAEGAPAADSDHRLSRPRPESSLAAVPDLDQTWEEADPGSVPPTIPVRSPEPRRSGPPGSGAAPAAPPAVPPAEPPGTPRAAAPGEARRGTAVDLRRPWVAVAAVIGLVLAGMIVIPRLLPSPPAGDAPPAPEAPGAGTPEAGGDTPPGGSGEEGDPDAVPAGWRPEPVGDTGYQVARPPSWEVRTNPLGDGSSLRFDGPQGRYLLVDWTTDPGPDARAAWEDLAASFARRHSNYRQIRLEETRFRDFPTAAVWEWTYSEGGADLHAINLGFADDSYGFALNFQTRAGDWEASRPEFEAFRASFRAG